MKHRRQRLGKGRRISERAVKQYRVVCHACSVGLEWQEEDRVTEKTFKGLTTEKFPNLTETVNSQTRAAQWTPGRRNMMRITPRCLIIRLLKTSDMKENLKSSQIAHYSSAPLSREDVSQDPQWVPETVASTRHYVYYFLPIHIHTPMIKFNFIN